MTNNSILSWISFCGYHIAYILIIENVVHLPINIKFLGAAIILNFRNCKWLSKTFDHGRRIVTNSVSGSKLTSTTIIPEKKSW